MPSACPSGVHNVSMVLEKLNLHPLLVATGTLNKHRKFLFDLKFRSRIYKAPLRVTIHLCPEEFIMVSLQVPRPRTRTDIPATFPDSERMSVTKFSRAAEKRALAPLSTTHCIDFIKGNDVNRKPLQDPRVKKL